MYKFIILQQMYCRGCVACMVTELSDSCCFLLRRAQCHGCWASETSVLVKEKIKLLRSKLKRGGWLLASASLNVKPTVWVHRSLLGHLFLILGHLATRGFKMLISKCWYLNCSYFLLGLSHVFTNFLWRIRMLKDTKFWYLLFISGYEAYSWALVDILCFTKTFLMAWFQVGWKNAGRIVLPCSKSLSEWKN